MISLRVGLAWLLVFAIGFWLGGRTGLLASFLIIAIATDLSARKIPNVLVFPGILVGIASQIWLPDGVGIAASLQGAGLGLIMFLPLYLLRAMGAGDVKLMAMVGAFVGSQQMLGAVLGTLLAGGVLSLLVAIRKQAFARLIGNLRLMAFDAAGKLALGQLPVAEGPEVSVGKLPYAVAIALGTWGFLGWQWLRQ